MKDCLGIELEEGDYVAGLYPHHPTPHLFRVVEFTPKKVRLMPLENIDIQVLKYPYDLTKLDEATVEIMLNDPPKDAIGRLLKKGDYVYGSDGEYIDPIIYEITDFTGRSANVKMVHGGRYQRLKLIATQNLLKVNPSDVTMHILRDS